MLAVAFDGNRFKGEILPELERLKRKRIIRIIDMLVVRKDAEGNLMTSTATDLGWEEATALGSYLGALAGYAAAGAAGIERGSMMGAAELADGHIFDEEDIFRVTRALPNNATAAVLLVEHTWALSLLEAVERAGGIELSNDWIRPEDILRMDAAPLPEAEAD